MGASFYIGLLLAIPLSIVANLVTPRVSLWWATRDAKRKARRIAKLTAELTRLTGRSPVATIVKVQPQPETLLSSDEFPLPQLKCRIGGRDVLASNISDGRLMCFTAENTELRFESRVHHLRARITFKPFKGETVVVKDGVFAIRMADDDGKNKEYFTNLTSFGMGGQVTLLAYVEVASRFYTVKKETVHAAMGEELRPGHWEVTVELTADNARVTERYQLELKPDGSSGIGPLVHK